MAAKKKKKAGASARAGASKKKSAKPAKAKKVKKASAKKSKAKKAKKPAKKTVKAAAKKAPVKKKKQIVGEGDYAASKSFDKDQSSFVEKNKAKIPAMGLAAEKALEGPEGDSLREAEASAAARSRDNF